MRRDGLFVGAVVRKKNGMPGKFQIVVLLANNRATIRLLPLLNRSEEAYLADLEIAPEGQDE